MKYMEEINISKSFGQEDAPQINSKTGVSMDYGNQFHFLGAAFRAFGGIQAVRDYLGHTGQYSDSKASSFHMRKYEEVYNEYKNVITDKNREAIKRINELADHMNEITKNFETISEEDFRKTYDELDALIYADTNSNL